MQVLKREALNYLDYFFNSDFQSLYWFVHWRELFTLKMKTEAVNYKLKTCM